MQINFINAANLQIYSCIISLILHILNPNVATHQLDQRKPGCKQRHSGRSCYSECTGVKGLGIMQTNRVNIIQGINRGAK